MSGTPPVIYSNILEFYGTALYYIRSVFGWNTNESVVHRLKRDIRLYNNNQYTPIDSKISRNENYFTGAKNENKTFYQLDLNVLPIVPSPLESNKQRTQLIISS